MTDLTVGDFRNLMDLRECTNRDALRVAWLCLEPEERAALRWDPRLAAHAWSVLKRDPATGGAA